MYLTLASHSIPICLLTAIILSVHNHSIVKLGATSHYVLYVVKAGYSVIVLQLIDELI